MPRATRGRVYEITQPIACALRVKREGVLGRLGRAGFSLTLGRFIGFNTRKLASAWWWVGEGDEAWRAVGGAEEAGRVDRGADDVVVPAEKPQPGGAGGDAGQRAAFAEGKGFAALVEFAQAVKDRGKISPGSGPGVEVARDDIDVIVAWIPIDGVVVVGGGPDPDEVVEPVVAGEPDEHEPVERLRRFGAARPPPEPAALGLVQRAPEHGHAGLARLLHLAGHIVQPGRSGRAFRAGFGDDHRTAVAAGDVGQHGAERPPRVVS